MCAPRVGHRVTAEHSRTSPSGHWGGGQRGTGQRSKGAWLATPKAKDEPDSPNSPNVAGAKGQALLRMRADCRGGGVAAGQRERACALNVPNRILIMGFRWCCVVLSRPGCSPLCLLPPGTPLLGVCPTGHARKRRVGGRGAGRAFTPGQAGREGRVGRRSKIISYR